MGNNGGKKSEAPRQQVRTQAAPVEAISKIAKTIETLEKRQAHLEKKQEAELRKAKAYLKKGKSGKRQAMHCLKRKKLFEKQLEQVANQMINLEQQKITLEGATTTKLVFDTQSTATRGLKDIQQGMNIENVEDLRDEMDEVTETQNELNELLSAPALGADMDDDDLLDELNELQEEDAMDAFTAVDSISIPSGVVQQQEAPVALPAAPSHTVTAPAAADEGELAELEALMAA